LAFDIRFTFRPKSIRRLVRLLDDFQPDALHIHGQFMDLAWLGSIYAAKRHVPVLLSVHTRLESPKAAINGVFRLIDKCFVAPLIRRANPTVVVMDALMDRYVSSTYKVAVEKRAPIPVGIEINLNPSNASEEDVRKKFSLGPGEIILSVGHVIALRDRIALVKALPAVLQEFPNAQLVVAGSVEYPEFLSVAESLQVMHAVHCLGRVPKTDVIDLFKIAAVEAHDLQGIGMGTANLEAMAAGVPVVVAVGSDNFPKFTLKDGTDVLLVGANQHDQIGAQICRVLREPEWARAVGESGRRLVAERFSIEAVTHGHLEVLSAMVAAK
jgi:glycosyltransferase involved in cell wall biosynthesis